MANQKKALLSAGSLQYKLRIAFCLMSILPLLVSVFFVSNYILPKAGFKLDITIAISIVVSVFISIVGFFVVKEVFDRVVSISSDAKMIVQGDTSRIIETGKDDEVGFLGDSLNQLTMQIRSNMEELKGYSERTTEINFEIQKRVLALSSLLQISSLISQGLKLDEILRLTVEKAHLLANSEIAFLFSRVSEEDNFYLKTAEGQNSVYLAKLKIDSDDPAFNKLIHYSKPLMLDSENVLSGNTGAAFYDKFRLKNVLALPIFLRGRVTAILGVGNNKEGFLYKKDDLELLDIFSKQISIAIENDLLSHWVEKLEIKDALTGLYNAAFIKSRLQEEIKRAIVYQRPCSFIMFNIDNFQDFQQNFGSLSTEGVLKRIATLIKSSITEIDRAGRTGDNEFGIVLPEKNKRQARDIAEEIRKKIEFTFGEEQDSRKKITASAAVSENPIDGLTAEELLGKAGELIEKAKPEGKNKVLI